MAESRALDLFNEYTGDAAAEILSGLPSTDPKTFENTWREFKSGYVKDEDFNRIWSEILGAFANTEGGVLVWGIYANTVPGSKIDAAVNLQPVEKPEEFTTRLKKAAKDAINPPLHGVDIRPVPLADGSGKGFVVCYIPEGKDKPYESLHCKERFFGRFDDRCERINLSFLRQLFNPQFNPRIDVELDSTVSPREVLTKMLSSKTGKMETGRQIWFDLTLTNVGSVSLYDAYFSINSPGFFFWKWEPDGPAGVKIEEIKFPKKLRPSIHPTMFDRFRFIAVTLELEAEAPFTITLYARDMAPKKATITLNQLSQFALYPNVSPQKLTRGLE